ncbi:CD276 antigen homolog isoform X2 [Sinocyclocheilus grahami]|uniref:CD276 antigen homolog isoform X1 n=1 Tax=Sinocyclocheilus grahami TaxID=75366 RepID=UPI0007ACF7D3|nr:PREDICTED: CD276 antigen homolog isoform X1 [Sinocyclocheilus grahami]XP_016106886.1 PREDICTED: CD276 antigen homolog isoform X2 [Sinocyclocheilus grahami]
MIIGCCFICAFFVLINKVCLQVPIEGFIGGSVVLPCSSAEHDLKLQDINVLWRDKGSETVYDIIKGKDSVERQNPRYKNRAETFPEEYERGNFSLKLINLNHTDSGEFSCFITHSSDSKQETVWLFINDSTAEKGNKSTKQENQEPGTQSDWITILLICVGTILILLFAVFIARFIIRRITTQAPYIGGTVAN